MEIASIKKASKSIRRLPQERIRIQADYNFEVRARSRAEKAFSAGAKYFEYRGFLFVRVDGKICEWSHANPKRIGRD